MQECVLFGAAQSGRRAAEILKDKYTIKAFADNDRNKWGTELDGIPVIAYPDLCKYKQTLIIVSSVYYRSISRQLAGDGFTNIKIFYLVGDFGGNGEMEYLLFDHCDKELFSECNKDFDFSYSLKKSIGLNYPDTENRKKVLFCAYIFPPLGGPGVQRSLKFVKYLRDFGYEPVVLTVGKNDRHIPMDQSLEKEIPFGVQVIRVDEIYPPEVLSVDKQQEILNLCYGVTGSKEWISRFNDFYLTSNGARLLPDDKITWVNECLRRITQLVNLNEIAAVYTTGYPFSSFLIGYYLKCSYGIPWVADYRDPWAASENYWNERYYQYADSKAIMQDLERCCIEEMDHMIVCSDPMKPEMQELYGIDPEKISIITNGFDEEDFKDTNIQRKNDKEFTLCHNGNIANYVDATKPITVINDLIDKGCMDAGKVKFVINGDVQTEQLKRMQEADRYGILRFNGRLSHKASLMIASGADLLVIYSSYGKGSENAFSGKIFEYMMLQRPVLCFSTANSMMTNVIRKCRIGQSFEKDRDDEVGAFLLKQYHDRENGVFDFDPDSEEIQKYNRRSLTGRLAGILDRIGRKSQ